MIRKAFKATLVAVTSLVMIGVLPGPAAQADPAPIRQVDCNQNDFLSIDVHPWGNWAESKTLCYANWGETTLPDFSELNWLVTKIWTGNNRVQWLGDGRWQPDTPIDKNLVYYFPNHHDGVRINAVRIIR